jgi:translocation and assembly module TamA
MASLSSLRPVKTGSYARRHFKLGLAFVTGLSQAAFALGATSAAAQAVSEDGSIAAAAQEADEAEVLVQTDLPPEPVPVPSSLDDLIPPDAVTNPDAWAAAGVGDPAPGLAPSSPALDDPLAGFIDPPDPTLQPAIDAIFAEFTLEVPEPLAPEPEVAALASLDAPVLGQLPDLAETQVSKALVLALPMDTAAFPESGEFISRFKALSTLQELDGGAESAPQVAARARADAVLLGDILRTYGYYDGEVVRQLSGGRRAGGDGDSGIAAADAAAREPSVRFDILPGTRYRFGKVDLGALPALPEPDASRLMAAFGIKPGDPLYADRIVERELELRVTLGESGYPFATLADPELLIDHARAEGDLTLDVQPGGQYVFGEVVSSDPGFLSGKHLARIARFDAGDLFRQSLETDLRRAVIATGLVSSVTITPREARAPVDGQPGEVALDVAFERAPLRTIAGAIGYGTEDGFKLETRWEHRNLFPPEGALRLRGILGTRETLASIGVRRNNFRGRDQVLNVDLFASDITTEAVDSRGFGLRGTFEKVSNILFQKPLSWQLGGELLYTDERNRTVRGAPGIPLPRRTFLIGGAFGSVTLDGSDDLLDPSEGYRATLFLAPEVSRSEGAESFYLRAQADASYYKSVGSTVLATRLRAATIQGASFDDIAPSRRLYGGGGGSVRGYGFQGVGPRNDRGEATGGASLLEFSIEARIETPLLDGAVEVVPFFDAGTVGLGSTPDFRFVRYGAGVGLRYKTTFGPIRIDVATPINPTEFDSPVVVYVSLGQAF